MTPVRVLSELGSVFHSTEAIKQHPGTGASDGKRQGSFGSRIATPVRGFDSWCWKNLPTECRDLDAQGRQQRQERQACHNGVDNPLEAGRRSRRRPQGTLR